MNCFLHHAETLMNSGIGSACRLGHSSLTRSELDLSVGDLYHFVNAGEAPAQDAGLIAQPPERVTFQFEIPEIERRRFKLGRLKLSSEKNRLQKIKRAQTDCRVARCPPNRPPSKHRLLALSSRHN